MINMIDEMIIDYKKCNEIVKILNKHFENKKDIANIEYSANIEVTARNIKKMSDVYVKISKEINISPSDIDKYL